MKQVNTDLKSQLKDWESKELTNNQQADENQLLLKQQNENLQSEFKTRISLSDLFTYDLGERELANSIQQLTAQQATLETKVYQLQSELTSVFSYLEEKLCSQHEGYFTFFFF